MDILNEMRVRAGLPREAELQLAAEVARRHRERAEAAGETAEVSEGVPSRNARFRFGAFTWRRTTPPRADGTMAS